MLNELGFCVFIVFVCSFILFKFLYVLKVIGKIDEEIRSLICISIGVLIIEDEINQLVRYLK